MTPGEYVPWCLARGLNPHHPDDWPEADRLAFARWKRECFRVKWDHHHATGYVHLLGARYRRQMADDIDAALRDAPSRPYKYCPCHPMTPRVRVFPNPLPRTAQACLLWLHQEFGGRHASE